MIVFVAFTPINARRDAFAAANELTIDEHEQGVRRWAQNSQDALRQEWERAVSF